MKSTRAARAAGVKKRQRQSQGYVRIMVTEESLLRPEVLEAVKALIKVMGSPVRSAVRSK
jgi:hypothetical protein